MHPDGTNKHPLTPPISNMEQKSGDFSPDGSKVVFAGRDNYGAWDIFTVNLNGSPESWRTPSKRLALKVSKVERKTTKESTDESIDIWCRA